MDDDVPNSWLSRLKKLAFEMLFLSLLDDGWKGCSYGNAILCNHYGINSSHLGRSAHVLPELVDNQATPQERRTRQAI